MSREQDVAAARERAKGGEDKYWYGYQVGIEGYSEYEADQVKHGWARQINPSGNRGANLYSIKQRAEVYGETGRFWLGYLAALEGLDLVGAEKKLEFRIWMENPDRFEGRGEDIRIAKERAGNGEKSLFWYGYQLALENYRHNEASNLRSSFLEKWQRDQIKPTGNNPTEIQYAVTNGKKATLTDAYFYVGYGVALEGLSLAEAEERFATDPRHGSKFRPWDGDKVRGVFSSLVIALAVSFVLSNILYFSFVSFIGLVTGQIAHKFAEFYASANYIAFIITLMGIEGLAWKSPFGAYMLARKHNDLKYVVKKAMFQNRFAGGSSCGTTTYIMTKNS